MVSEALQARNIREVGRALDLLNEELERIMRLTGTPSIGAIGRDHVDVKF